jgi:Domain of unknown function (DUF1707)
MTAPDNHPTPSGVPGSGRTRLGDDERDGLAEALGHHYVAGRLDAEALTARVEAVYGAEFRDEAEAALADLPAPEPAAPAPSRARRGWLRRRGHGESEQAQPGWRPTPERFRDPTTDRIMRVWIDPADGKRHYVAE